MPGLGAVRSGLGGNAFGALPLPLGIGEVGLRLSLDLGERTGIALVDATADLQQCLVLSQRGLGSVEAGGLDPERDGQRPGDGQYGDPGPYRYTGQ